MNPSITIASTVLDCAALTTRAINQQLKTMAAEGITDITVQNPAGRHNLGVGLADPVNITFQWPVGYYCGGLADGVRFQINGSCGWSVGENLMSGEIVVHGNASAMAGASAHGGTICIMGNAGPRAGIALKGATLIVLGSVGHSSAFMMQQGRCIICGDAGPNLGDSIYDGEIFVAGAIESLGADAQLSPVTDTDWDTLTRELQPWGITARVHTFKKVVCAKQLYHFKAKDFAKWKDAY